MKNLDGLKIKGIRNITTHPAGFMGNDRPTTAISETWSSPELQVRVIQKHTDARIGEKIQTLIHLSRAEPDSMLFQVPQGYKIAAPKEPFTITAVADNKQTH